MPCYKKFSDDEISMLKQAFAAYKYYPPKKKIRELAKTMKTKSLKVENWFKYNRRKMYFDGDFDDYRIRKTFNNEEFLFLLDIFKSNKNPDLTKCQEISQQMKDISGYQIKNWFANQRRKAKSHRIQKIYKNNRHGNFSNDKPEKRISMRRKINKRKRIEKESNSACCKDEGKKEVPKDNNILVKKETLIQIKKETLESLKTESTVKIEHSIQMKVETPTECYKNHQIPFSPVSQTMFPFQNNYYQPLARQNFPFAGAQPHQNQCFGAGMPSLQSPAYSNFFCGQNQTCMPPSNSAIVLLPQGIKQTLKFPGNYAQGGNFRNFQSCVLQSQKYQFAPFQSNMPFPKGVPHYY